jgi:hypothetical protein
MQQVVKKCDPWPQPKVPFVSQPFFGRYSSTGAPGGGVDTSTVPQGAPAPQTTPQNGTGVGTTPSGGQSYPPDQYASPPQQAPPGQTPPAGQGGGTGAPPAGNGTG